MGRSRITAALCVLFAAVVVAAPGALAATPQEIYRDYTDNGVLDGNYTKGELEAALKNATLQGYPSPTDEGLKPEVEEEIDEGTSGGTAGGSSGGGTAGGGTAPVQSSGGLPFTGLDLSLIVAGALGLILLGGALRRIAKQRA